MPEYTGTESYDYIYASSIADIINALGGNDYIQAYGGNDTIYSGGGSDTAYGGDGDDFFDDYSVSSFGGDDYFYGGAGNDVMYGWTGYDRLYGEAGNDRLYGEGDSDTLDGGIGADTMEGGTGSDTYFVDSVLDQIVEVESATWSDYDTVYSGVSITLSAYLEVLYLTGREGLSATGNASANSIYGNDSNNLIYGLGESDRIYGRLGNDNVFGGDGNDELYGDQGNDQVSGDGGNDSLYASLGADTLAGGQGDDTYFVYYYYDTDFNDVIVEAADASGGNDTVYTSSESIIWSGIENLQFYDNDGGGGNLIGNDSDNRIYGGYYNDQIFGGRGADSLYGSEGNDTLDGGTGTDYFDGEWGVDTVRYADNLNATRIDLAAGVATFMAAVAQTETLVSIENAIGGAAGDTFIGNAVANAFYGGLGNDSFDGGAGTDFFDGGEGSDTALYAVNTSAIRADLSTGVISFPGRTWPSETVVNVENVTTGSGADTLIGSTLANALRGGLAADTLTGGLGADLFVFGSAAESTTAARDRLIAGGGAVAFEGAGAAAGDRFDFAGIDAVAGGADNAFRWGGTTQKGAGFLWLSSSGTDTIVNGNTDADAAIEFQVAIADGAVGHTAYTAADFIL